jgi:hypothetical protein
LRRKTCTSQLGTCGTRFDYSVRGAIDPMMALRREN